MEEYKKSSSIMVFNDEGKLLLQLRAPDDDSFPLHWDFSAGGGIEKGEDEKFSAKRELQEELGIKTEIDFVTKEQCTYPAWIPNTTRVVDLWLYIACHNGPFHPDSTEVDRVEFFTIETIAQMIKSGHKFHPEFIFAWNKGLVVK
jgi:isopentenyldiphosphate isomerase